MWAENGYKERATATTHKMATQTNATEQTLHNTLNGQQLTTHTGRHRRRNTNTPGPEEHSAIRTLGTSCSKQGEQQWAKETVFIGGEYCGKTVSGLKMVFIGGEYWGTTVSGLKMGNNSQWAEDGFYWWLKTDIREPLQLHTKCQHTHRPTQKERADTLMSAENGYKERATAITHKMATQKNATEQNPT